MIQSIIFSKDKFTLKESKHWLLKHNYKIKYYGKKPDITENYYRFRQAAPIKAKYYIKKIDDGILFVYYY